MEINSPKMEINNRKMEMNSIKMKINNTKMEINSMKMESHMYVQTFTNRLLTILMDSLRIGSQAMTLFWTSSSDHTTLLGTKYMGRVKIGWVGRVKIGWVRKVEKEVGESK